MKNFIKHSLCMLGFFAILVIACGIENLADAILNLDMEALLLWGKGVAIVVVLIAAFLALIWLAPLAAAIILERIANAMERKSFQIDYRLRYDIDRKIKRAKRAANACAKLFVRTTEGMCSEWH